MKKRFTLAVAVTVLMSLTACTAITLSRLSGTDLPVDAGGSGGDPTGIPDGGGGPCSLLVFDPNSSSPEVEPANACSTCIQNNCANDVKTACNQGGTAKSWFTSLTSCAEGPYLDYGPPEAGLEGETYECGKYRDAGPAYTTDLDSDPALQRTSEICVNEKCMQGATPPCAQCPVWVARDETRGSGNSDIQFLSDDTCGRCFSTPTCQAAIVKCCATRPVSEFLQYCAYTSNPDYKPKCAALGDPTIFDAGEGSRIGDFSKDDVACLQLLTTCFNDSNCASQCPAPSH